MKLFKFYLITLTLFLSSLGFSQDEDAYVGGNNTSSNSTNSSVKKGFDWDRVTIGGGLGLSFGTITVIEVAPNFGYYLTDNILAGVGGRYSYYSDNDINQSTSVYGGRVYGEYLFGELPFLAHTEAELINLEWTQDRRRNIVNVYVGGGIKQRLGNRSYFYILGLWNLNETKESFILQPNPIIRGGIAIGL
jgi:hypothetical protein